MPRTNINYSNTTIYKLCCKDLSITDIYIGHTTDMRKRKNVHKSTCNNEKDKSYNSKVYTFIRDNGGWDNWDMIDVERFEAIDGNDAKKKERYYIEIFKATLNMVIPSRTNKEYYEDNKEHLDEKRKEWHKENKEHFEEKKKEWREENKEYLLKKNKEYYENNKDIINSKVKCECGCEINKQGLIEHKKTKKHINLMSKLSDTVVNYNSN
jgi:hypothetical protein